jgi:hypothetical protein
MAAPHRKVERIRRDRHLTADEAAAERELRAKIETDLPSLREQARAARLQMNSRSLSRVTEALKAERQRQCLSLQDIERRTGVKASELERLEEQNNGDVTIAALLQYAAVLGKAVEVRLMDQTVLAE